MLVMLLKILSSIVLFKSLAIIVPVSEWTRILPLPEGLLPSHDTTLMQHYLTGS